MLRRETFLHFRDKNHSLLIHSSSFVSISHNKEITPTCDKSTHIHQTSLKSASNRKQKDDSFITEWAREHRSLSARLNSERLSGMEWKCTDLLCIFDWLYTSHLHHLKQLFYIKLNILTWCKICVAFGCLSPSPSWTRYIAAVKQCGLCPILWCLL